MWHGRLPRGACASVRFSRAWYSWVVRSLCLTSVPWRTSAACRSAARASASARMAAARRSASAAISAHAVALGLDGLQDVFQRHGRVLTIPDTICVGRVASPGRSTQPARARVRVGGDRPYDGSGAHGRGDPAPTRRTWAETPPLLFARSEDQQDHGGHGEPQDDHGFRDGDQQDDAAGQFRFSAMAPAPAEPILPCRAAGGQGRKAHGEGRLRWR